MRDYLTTLNFWVETPEIVFTITLYTPPEKLDKLIDIGLIDTFRYLNKEPGHYSWWAYYRNLRERNIGWRIDYIFISKSLKKNLKEASILKDIGGSDHCPISMEINV